jgi:hypothetical protein
MSIYVQVSLKNLTQNVSKKLVLPQNIDQKLQIFVITSICKPIFVTVGGIGTRLMKGATLLLFN